MTIFHTLCTCCELGLQSITQLFDFKPVPAVSPRVQRECLELEKLNTSALARRVFRLMIGFFGHPGIRIVIWGEVGHSGHGLGQLLSCLQQRSELRCYLMTVRRVRRVGVGVKTR